MPRNCEAFFVLYILNSNYQLKIERKILYFIFKYFHKIVFLSEGNG